MVHFKVRPGQYVFPGMVIAETSVPLNLKSFLAFSDDRKTAHDAEFAVRQLNEIAVRSMESGLKDPYTVITCMDRMGAALCLLKNRILKSGVHLDRQGKARVYIPTTDFAGLTNSMFHQIRQFGSKSPAVMIRLLDVLGTVMEILQEPEHQEHLLRHARLVRKQGKEAASNPADQQDLEERFQRVLGHCKQPEKPEQQRH
ncbi:hypothetical protein GCM10008938_19300 [Deinococcus roseus]|uniref:DUF2254 domain-containing protein n=1 Tax=Deinococcus roseus TaxID=392414 RepID=A0ABQ2D124_9DEIO|nr:hypothetical protein GCM10008938_19300 [Deinococcus roseus]